MISTRFFPNLRQPLSTRPFSCILLLMSTFPGLANSQGIDYYSAADLQAKAKAMGAKENTISNTPVVNPLAKNINDYTLLVYRNADGQAELHEHESDLYLVVEGEAMLVSGGTMLDRKVKSPGEFTGSGIANGQSQTLRKGDVVHIAPNLPHQLKVKSGQSFSYFVEKVKEQ